jgi:SAM-dependent methyltransferase
MPDHPSERTHENRARALAFGGVAATYDRARPSYPSELIDALMEFAPRRVLDVGCGTGKASRLLLDRGCDVLGVEPDPSMAAVARGHGVAVEEATFETWDPRGRVYDLVISGQAWHWVNPEVGVPKAGSLLHAAGHLGVFWNHGRPADPAAATLDAVYARIAPEIARSNLALNPPPEAADRMTEFGRGGFFTKVAVLTFPWVAIYDRAGWIEFVSTLADHILLPDGQRRALLEALGEAVDALGGTLTYNYWTLLVLAKRGM